MSSPAALPEVVATEEEEEEEAVEVLVEVVEALVVEEELLLLLVSFPARAVVSPREPSRTVCLRSTVLLEPLVAVERGAVAGEEDGEVGVERGLKFCIEIPPAVCVPL